MLNDTPELFAARLLIERIDALGFIGKYNPPLSLEVRKAYIDLLILFCKSNLYRLSNKIKDFKDEDSNLSGVSGRSYDPFAMGFNSALLEERLFYQQLISKLQELLKYNPEPFCEKPGNDRQMELEGVGLNKKEVV